MNPLDDDTSTRTGLWVVFSTVTILLISVIIWVLKGADGANDVAAPAAPASSAPAVSLLTALRTVSSLRDLVGGAASIISAASAGGALLRAPVRLRVGLPLQTAIAVDPTADPQPHRWGRVARRTRFCSLPFDLQHTGATMLDGVPQVTSRGRIDPRAPVCGMPAP